MSAYPIGGVRRGARCEPIPSLATGLHKVLIVLKAPVSEVTLAKWLPQQLHGVELRGSGRVPWGAHRRVSMPCWPTPISSRNPISTWVPSTPSGAPPRLPAQRSFFKRLFPLGISLRVLGAGAEPGEPGPVHYPLHPAKGVRHAKGSSEQGPEFLSPEPSTRALRLCLG